MNVLIFEIMSPKGQLQLPDLTSTGEVDQGWLKCYSLSDYRINQHYFSGLCSNLRTSVSVQ